MLRSLALVALAVGWALAQDITAASTESSSKVVKAFDIHHHFVCVEAREAQLTDPQA